MLPPNYAIDRAFLFYPELMQKITLSLDYSKKKKYGPFRTAVRLMDIMVEDYHENGHKRSRREPMQLSVLAARRLIINYVDLGKKLKIAKGRLRWAKREARAARREVNRAAIGMKRDCAKKRKRRASD